MQGTYIIMITQVDTHLKYNIMQSTYTNYYPVDTHLKHNIMQSTHTNYYPVDMHLNIIIMINNNTQKNYDIVDYTVSHTLNVFSKLLSPREKHHTVNNRDVHFLIDEYEELI